MKNILAFLMITIVLIQCTVKTGMWGYYCLNKKYIATYLCENKARPELQCNGKCYIVKKIREQEKRENQLFSFLKECNEMIFNESNAMYAIKSPLFALIEPVYNGRYTSSYHFLSQNSIFQPPRQL